VNPSPEQLAEIAHKAFTMILQQTLAAGGRRAAVCQVLESVIATTLLTLHQADARKAASLYDGELAARVLDKMLELERLLAKRKSSGKAS
jgi:hypothetical protein